MEDTIVMWGQPVVLWKGGRDEENIVSGKEKQMKMALVDDDRQFMEQVKSLAKRLFDNAKRELVIDCYTDGKIAGDYDIYLLDIEMPDVNGLEIAKEIRMQNKDAYIIILTNHEQYALLGYEWRVYRYILKAKFEINLERALNSILLETESQYIFYEIKTNSEWNRFAVGDIVSIKSEGKYVVFGCRDKVFRERTSVREVLKRIPPGEFVQIDRGLIINMRYVRGIKREYITLESGEEMYISRNRQSEVKRCLARYWGGM